MNNFRRNQQISESEINTFKENKIKELLEIVKKTTPKRKWFRNPFALASALVLTTLLIVLSIVIFTPNNKDYTLTQLSFNEYLLESEFDDKRFNLYYKASIFSRGDRIQYEDKFEYLSPFIYVDEDIAKQYKVDFNVFRLSQYRYFLEIKFNNQLTYIEANYYPQHSLNKELVNLEINDLEKDITALYKMIEKYPPELLTPFSPNPVYSIHPDVNTLGDSKEKRNYIKYVENYYIAQDYNIDSVGDYEHKNITIYQHHVGIVDADGKIIETTINSSYAFNVIPDPYDIFTKSYDSLFDFYLIGEDKAIGISTFPLENIHYNVEGYYRVSNFEEKLYIYSYISLLHSNVFLDKVAYVELTYTLSEAFSNKEISMICQPFYYNKALIIPPILMSENKETDNYIESFSYKFYSENDQLLHSFTNND